MKRSTAMLAAWLTLGLAALLAPSVARGIIPCPHGCPDPDVVDCGNEPQSKVCEECCTQSACACGDACLICCPDPQNCLIVNPPKPLGLSLGVKVTVGGVTLAFQRKVGPQNNPPSVGIKLREMFMSTTSRRTVTVQTTLTGADAVVGSLLYPVAFLGKGSSALDALHAQGYNVSIAGTPSQTCQSVLVPAQACTDLANQLAQTLGAALATGDSAERDAFLTGVQALGFQSCQGVTTTTTTSSTTSTTLCPTGQTDCSGTCVNLMTDPNNCGSCGTVCPSTTCIGGVCTIP